MRAIILARVSTEEQKEAGNSLPAQISRLERYCERNNLDIINTYSFDESAYKTKRDEFDKILSSIKSIKEKVAVCFDKVDRFSRNVFDQRVAKLYDLAMADKIELHFANDNLIINSSISATEKFQFGINLGLAKYYSDAISDNTKRAIENKIKDGKITGKAPIGYLNIKDEDKNVLLDPDRAPFVKKIFKLYASENYSMKGLVDYFEKAGLRSNTPQKNVLKHNQIEAILKNPFYYGVRKYKGNLYPHVYEPLISEKLFTRCKNVRDKKYKGKRKTGKNTYILQRLISCKKCGCAITPEIVKNKYIYYHCTNFHGNCERKYIREEELVSQITNILENLKLTPIIQDQLVTALRKNEESKNSFHKNQLIKLQVDYNKVDNHLKIMYEDRLEGRLSAAEYDTQVEKQKIKQQEILHNLEKYKNANTSYYITASKILDVASRASELFESSEIDEKRLILKNVLQNLKLDDKKLTYELKTPYNMLFLYNTKTPSKRKEFLWGAQRESNPH
jgi:site-specific DNA recombinase